MFLPIKQREPLTRKKRAKGSCKLIIRHQVYLILAGILSQAGMVHVFICTNKILQRLVAGRGSFLEADWQRSRERKVEGVC